MNKPIGKKSSKAVTQNACKLCGPLGASMVFRGIDKTLPILHGSQGCSTYIRRYLISHFREPIDIASSNFSEDTAIFGGEANLKESLDNIASQYEPEAIGVATTCLSETIGDDIGRFVKNYKKEREGKDIPEVLSVSTPSYSGTHIEGFHKAVKAIVQQLVLPSEKDDSRRVALFPGMLSPADFRLLKELFADFGLEAVLVPDYSDTLDGPLWTDYHKIPRGGTPVSSIKRLSSAEASMEMGEVNASFGTSRWLKDTYDVPSYSLGIPLGVEESDKLMGMLEEISGNTMPRSLEEERGRLLDSYADGHKYLFEKRAVLFGEEDMVIALARFCKEIGIVPSVCGSGGDSGMLKKEIAKIFPDHEAQGIVLMEGADFIEIEKEAVEHEVDICIGNSKGVKMARAMDKPLIRVSFPIHDRLGGQRILHTGYKGTQQLFDSIVNALLAYQQNKSEIGYFYQ